VDQFVRDNDSIEKALDIVDEEILIKELGFKQNCVRMLEVYGKSCKED
jgi:hypothetical protein